jgi:hypothetical protein
VCLSIDGSLIVLVDGPFVKTTGHRKKIYEGEKLLEKYYGHR